MSSEVRARGAEDWIGSRRTDAKSVRSTEPEILPSGIKTAPLETVLQVRGKLNKECSHSGGDPAYPTPALGEIPKPGEPVTAGLDPKTWRSSSFT